MSVPLNERSEGKLEVIVKARELAVYTIQITNNPKNCGGLKYVWTKT